MEQPEHQTVLIHDARHVVQRINAKKQSGESECALLDRAELFGHRGSRWYYSSALPGLQVISSARADRVSQGGSIETRPTSSVAGGSRRRIDPSRWCEENLRLRPGSR